MVKNRIMATPKDVVIAAYQYLLEVTGSTGKFENIRLEELEQNQADKSWKVVLSYDAVGEFPFDRKREYKEFSIDAEKNVLSMKIKKV